MASKIRNLKITEISLVDRPANPGAAVLLHKRDEGTEMDYANIDRADLALLALEGAGEAIRKREPELTKEQAFAKACAQNPEIFKIERQASRARISGVNVARTEPVIEDSDEGRALTALYAEFARRFPYLSAAELQSTIDNSAEMRAHRAQFRASIAAARRAGSTLPPGAAAVAKRNNAMDELNVAADELRKRDPNLSREQAFAKAYKFNPDLAARERAAAR